MRRVLLLVIASAAALAAQSRGPIVSARFLAHVQRLAADDLEGRGNGSEGLARAAAYVRERFRAAGLTGAVAGAFEQPFEAEVRVVPRATTTLVLGTRRFVIGRDFHPLSIIERRPEEPAPALDAVPVVFAGYGIAAPGLGYDDFEGVDLRDAAVLVFTHEPQERDERSPFDGRNLTPGAAVSQKAREARERGARLLLVVEDPAHADDRATRPAWWNDPQSENLGIPVVRIARDRVADALPMIDLPRVAARIDASLHPQSRRLDDVRLSYVEERAQFTARLENIVGLLPGSDPGLSREAVVVGAHYDHIGRGGEFSDAPEATGQVHNGADDNASGVAALIELAGAAARTRERFRRTIVFAAFAGEELGLRGSEHYVEAPPLPLDRTRAMVNLDMVGRAHGRVMVGVFGPPTPVPFSRLRAWTRLTVEDFARGGYDADESDVGPFARHGVPAVAFFTGFHADYHRPSDDWPTIDAAGGAAIAELALRLVEELAR